MTFVDMILPSCPLSLVGALVHPFGKPHRLEGDQGALLDCRGTLGLVIWIACGE
jgi:hypothetical protein